MSNKNEITTEKDKNIVAIYLKDIGDHKNLSHEDEISLWKDYKINKNIHSRDKLIKSQLKFVAKIAKSYIGMGLSYIDLIGEGNIGLMRAIEKFDANMGYRLTTYSVWWIKQSILEALQKRNHMMMDDLPNDNIKDDLGIINNTDEIIEQSNYEVNNYFITNDIEKKSDHNKKILTDIINETLNEREKSIIIEYYGFNGDQPKTLEEIGDDMGITKERVRQISNKALKKLRSACLLNNVSMSIY